MNTISNERLEKMAAGGGFNFNEVEAISSELLALRKERERAEPVGYRKLFTCSSCGAEGLDEPLESRCHCNGDGARWIEGRLYIAPPAPVVADDVLAALRNVAKIRLDFNDFDGDRRGMADCLGEAEEALIEVVNRRAAMLNQSQPVAETDTTSQQFESLAGKAVGEYASSMADAHMAWLNTNFPRNAYSDEEWEEVSLYTWLAWRDSQRNACFPGT
ncbi:hypothetical protein ACOZ0W_002710 [Cronobacter dublinensis]